MGMARPFSILSTTLLLLFLSSSATERKAQDDIVHSSCVHASYPKLCLQTLSTCSDHACKTPRDLAQAAVKVSLSRARRLSSYLAQVPTTGANTRQQAALRDCAEQISDTVDDLSKTLSELKHLGRSGEAFQWQMSNAQTWVSAALTNEDTCLDGIPYVDDKKIKSDVRRKIKNVAKVTSNALYMINRLDESRGRRDP
ncbi:pectinesterase inhibitor 3 [Juglans microcarpa x Juglans regia]|uniref:pectinesterase inhibitor 3 n=1 Tax=Juglans microcarpa x Juglans regia TaxID=2249226 RepID=UPI001B7E4280|nr:pectinesterase inhibitor 3 [Juglans microcarpa x Juglans regia]